VRSDAERRNEEMGGVRQTRGSRGRVERPRRSFDVGCLERRNEYGVSVNDGSGDRVN
jgi:hypothetical protein